MPKLSPVLLSFIGKYPGLMRALAWLRGLGKTFEREELSLRAMSLVFTTLLAIVPFCALSFSLLKAFGMHNRLAPVLYEGLRPLGEAEAMRLAHGLVGFVDKVQVGVLGAVGVVLLLGSAVALIQKVEATFNRIWGIRRQGGFVRRMAEYLALLTMGPVVVIAAMGVLASFAGNWLGYALSDNAVGVFLGHWSARLLPLVLVVLTFSFLYGFIPNTKVKLKAAFTGGLVAGVLWHAASVVFAQFVTFASTYNALYSGFALGVFALLWLYWSWLILLLGAAVSAQLQNCLQLELSLK